MITTVLSIDPGRAKCGIAVVSGDEGVLVRTIVAGADLRDTVRLLAARFKPEAIVVGGGTGADAIMAAVSALSIPFHVVDEKFSTQKARVRFFRDNPPRGWRRLVPRGMLTPDEPYDDYAAILLAESFLRAQSSTEPAANL